MTTASWTLITKSPALARSSHCLLIQNGRAFIYGGELKPRTPVDTEDDLIGCMHTLDIKDNFGAWTIANRHREVSSGTVPIPRVGAAAVHVNGYAYVWGGRGGKDMAPIGGEQTGMWRAALRGDQKLRWERIASADESASPECRSYHAMAVAQDTIFIHAGCPASGRLSTLHAFNTLTSSWTKLTPAPEPGRGGTTLASTTINGKPVLIRHGGFAGHELDSLDVYDIVSDTWTTATPEPDPTHGIPGARSVHGLVRYRSSKIPEAIALLFHGEKDASTLGHAGAGTFWDDVWLLLHDHEDGKLLWRKVSVSSEHTPEARGWFASAAFESEKSGETLGAVMHGGLLSSNQRADDMWVLKVT